MTDPARQLVFIVLVLAGLVAVLATVIYLSARNNNNCPDSEATACPGPASHPADRRQNR